MSSGKSNDEDEKMPQVIGLKCNMDDRGFLYQIFGNYLESFPDVKRIYVVGNFQKGVIRGLHGHNFEWKAYFAVKGSAKFVVVGKNRTLQYFVISSLLGQILIVPPKFPHGWVSLEDGTTLVGMSNRTLDESLADDFREDPLSIGKEAWEIKPR